MPTHRPPHAGRRFRRKFFNLASDAPSSLSHLPTRRSSLWGFRKPRFERAQDLRAGFVEAIPAGLPVFDRARAAARAKRYRLDEFIDEVLPPALLGDDRQGEHPIVGPLPFTDALELMILVVFGRQTIRREDANEDFGSINFRDDLVVP